MVTVRTIQLFILLVMLLSSAACVQDDNSIEKERWGEVGGKAVFLFTLRNSQGMEIKITNYGGIITSVLVPDRNGVMADVVLGFDNLQQYIDDRSNLGATIGRFANRIRSGQFSIGDDSYQLTMDKWGHTLHGGDEFAKSVWNAKSVKSKMGEGVQLHYYSKDDSHGFPGNLDAYVTYTLTESNAVQVEFASATDKATHINMTQHSYFNLSGGEELIYDHMVHIDADYYTEFDDQVIPTGRLLPLEDTAWNLSSLTRLGDKMDSIPLNGYHHCYVLNRQSKELKKVAKVVEPKSGRMLEVSTTQPGLVLYASNVLSDKIIGKYDIQYQPHMGLCIETQHYPDTPNHPNFPSSLLYPNEEYREIVIYDFGISKIEI